MDRSWANFLLTRPHMWKSKEPHSALRPQVQPFTSWPLASSFVNILSALEALLSCLLGLMPCIQSLKDGEGMEESRFDHEPQPQICQHVSRTLMEPISETFIFTSSVAFGHLYPAWFLRPRSEWANAITLLCCGSLGSLEWMTAPHWSSVSLSGWPGQPPGASSISCHVLHPALLQVSSSHHHD